MVIGGRQIPKMEKPPRNKITLQPTGIAKKTSVRTRSLKLNEITKPLTLDSRKKMMLTAMDRILKSEKRAIHGGVSLLRTKIITTLVAQYSSDMKHGLLQYIYEDIPERSDLAFSWLYEEYCFVQGFNRTSSLNSSRHDDTEYNLILCKIIRGVMDYLVGLERESHLRRFYLESPIITEEAISLLKKFALENEKNALIGVKLMKDLVMIRPTKQLNFLNSLLEFCSHEIVQVRETAIETVLQLHSKKDLATIIEEYSVMYLKFLSIPNPPSMLFSEERGRPHVIDVWTEDIIKVCLYLYLSLLPVSLKLFPNLASVYASTSGDVKRTILRALEVPLRNIDMESPELLDLVEKCPKGSEILVTRIIHILTENKQPPVVLVDKVRELYSSRLSDVRFLIPILTGLSKKEIVSALPDLIKLNQIVVKEVFSRLLGSNSPISPSDLLIALHTVDCDMKPVIKATAICFAEKSIYTQEVLAIVLQQLMELPNMPLLLMRTVIQSYSAYPRLIGFIMNILQRLIVKQVWKQKMLWDGFVKCCERTVPQSYGVMLQLPPVQLREFFVSLPSMRESLLEHVQGFTEAQRAHVSAATMEVLYNVVKAEPEIDNVVKSEPMEEEEDELAEPGPPGE